MTYERRAHARLDLRLPVLFIRKGWPHPVYICSQTENISIGGFCCQTNEMLSLGECLEFLMILPAATTTPAHEGGVYLRGAGEIARLSVDSTGGGFGIGVRIKSFSVATELDDALADGRLVIAQLRAGCRQR
jgi:hypothetical protein